MAQLVFLRGANVGGHRTFRPSQLATDLAKYGASSIGAAGTFLVRESVPRAALRAEFQRRLPFDTEVLICPARELLGLARPDPFETALPGKAVRRCVSMMDRPPRARANLPLLRPEGRAWEVQIIALRGRFALSLWRRRGRAILYPNGVVEKCLGVRATTRGWETVQRICELLA